MNKTGRIRTLLGIAWAADGGSAAGLVPDGVTIVVTGFLCAASLWMILRTLSDDVRAGLFAAMLANLPGGDAPRHLRAVRGADQGDRAGRSAGR